MSFRWTAEQAEAITSTRHTLLSASAGTGKTTTIVGKVLWALGLEVGRERGSRMPIPPFGDPLALEEIAAITFTEKAAHDLQEKLRTSIEASERGRELRWELERATIGTIHGFAADLLREHALRLGIDPTFRILDPRETEIQQGEIVRDVLAEALAARDAGAVELTKRYGLEGWRMSPGAVDRVRDVVRDLRWRARTFDHWSLPTDSGRYTRELDLAGLRERARFADAWAEEAEERAKDELALGLSDTLYRLGRASVGAWLSWLERENARDFDSLILDARRLLTRTETRRALEAVRRRYRLFIIDEFQDTDRAQWEIARAIMGPDLPGPAPQLVLVGDPKQSIYRFRGADIGVWNEARDLLRREGRLLELSWNFRCEPRLVEYVNRAGRRAIEETARPLARSRPESVIAYHPLRGARKASPAAGLEWLAVDAARAAERREEEASRVAGRLSELIGSAVVVDPEDDRLRRCRASDIAILGRRHDDLAPLQPALRRFGVPSFDATSGGLGDQQEILDLVTALRLIENPFDDLRAFAYLRSPFVGLRDEVLVRIATDREAQGDDAGAPLLRRAERYLEACEADPDAWFPAPEGALVDRCEREGLRTGLAAIRTAQALGDRADHAEVLETLLEETDYRLHLLLRDDAGETLANIERFLALLGEYRHLPLIRFLALWDRWGQKELGIPQARLHSSADDVVTLSTIHAAKGLEWPIVVLVGTGAALTHAGRFVGTHWGDPSLGPVFLPKAAERGPRAEMALARRIEEEKAEEARLLYVAATRARDRLIVVGPSEPGGESFASWLGVELPDAREAHEVAVTDEEPDTPARRDARARARVDDAASGTGSQIEAEGLGPRRQLDLFDAPPRDPAEVPGERPGGPMIIRRQTASIQTSLAPPPISLDWLAEIEPAPLPAAVEPVPSPWPRAVTSATERMLRERDPDAWALRYRHGVLPPDRFLAAPPPGELPGPERGSLIHGVLERIRDAEELQRVLDETIASLDLADLEVALAPGSPYRRALAREIARVVRSPEWDWYVRGKHYREIGFLRRDEDGWIQGAFDLLRPRVAGDASELEQASLFAAPEGSAAAPVPWVIDFKTHGIDAAAAPEIAATYAIQAEVYRAAATALLDGAADGETDAAAEGGPARVALHFTRPNVAVEV